MSKIIYHGSSDIIEKPVFGKGRLRNDYGLGFYCTENLSLAKEWSSSKNKNGYANIYEIDDDCLSVLNLNSAECSILHWISILLDNRTFDVNTALARDAKDYLLQAFPVPYKEYDVIIGYRADDSHFAFAQDFINGAISLRQLGNAMRLGDLGIQYVLKSPKAFESLSFKGYEVAGCDEWFLKKCNRDSSARRLYFDQERNKRQRGDIYITQILDEEMKADDSRLR